MPAPFRDLAQRYRAGLVALPLALVLFAYRSVYGFGFTGDAEFLIASNRFMAGWRDLWANVTHEYFWSSSGEAIAYWRPLTKASWLVERQLFGLRPGAFFAVHMAWLCVGAAGVAALARRWGASWGGACVAAAVFGLHPAVIEPACLLMARSDVVSAAGVAWSLVAFSWWRARGGALPVAAHVLALAVALASKEQALGVAPALAAWVALDRDPARDPRRELRWLVPAGVTVAAYLAARAWVLRDAAAHALALDPLKVFVGMARSLGGLLPLRTHSGLRSVSREEALSVGSLAASLAAWGAVLAGALVAWRRRHGPALVALVWMLGSIALVLLPARIAVPGTEGKISVADRWLLQAVMATAVLAGLAVDAARARSPRWGAALAVLVSAWCAVNAAVASPRRAAYRSDVALMAQEDRQYAQTDPRYRTTSDRCRASIRGVIEEVAAGRPDRAVAVSEAAPAACQGLFELRFNTMAAKVEARRFAEAAQELHAIEGHSDEERRCRSAMHYLGGVSLLETGRASEAERHFAEAHRYGWPGCRLFVHAARAAADQGHFDQAARRLERADACDRADGHDVPGTLRLAITFWQRAGRPDRAEALARRLNPR